MAVLRSCTAPVPGLRARGGCQGPWHRCSLPGGSCAFPEHLLQVPWASSAGGGCLGESAGLGRVLGRGQRAWGERRQVWRAALEAGWPAVLKLLLTLLSSPQGGPTGGPHLPSATPFCCLLCSRVSSATTAQALCTSFLAGHGIGRQRGPGAERLCDGGRPQADAASGAVGGSGRCPVPHLPGHHAQRSLRARVLPPLLLRLHPAVGQQEGYVPALQAAF